MDNSDILSKISDLERDIATLPPGTLGTKKVNGKDYYYHRYMVNGKRVENYVDFDAVDELKIRIEKRKELEKELKKLKQSLTKDKPVRKKKDSQGFRTYVRTGEQLKNWALPAKNYKHRECYEDLKEYVFGDISDRVFVLYGLRRTGKTTMLRQIVLDMSNEDIDKTAFIQVSTKDSLADVNKDLRYLEDKGYKYVFIDEVTLMEDFIEGAALFSDIYACSGMKIVLSGTDSLGFVFSESDQLYDRCIMLHTTFISYREFEDVLGIKGVDEFIRYGGTMSMGGVHYNESSTFASKDSADEYIDTAIARNIQHSLKYYQDGGHFRHLYELYSKKELTSAINRVVEDINHRFTLEVLTKTYHSDTLSVSARNLLNDRKAPFYLMDNIDSETVLSSIRKILDILEKEEQSVEVSDTHAYEIREYLLLLDMITGIDQVYLPDLNRKEKIIIAQPGLRYAQVKAIIDVLLMDEKFNELSIVERKRVTDRIMNTIEGAMMEDLVLLETKLSKSGKEVLQLQFAAGEFDMVVSDPETLTCEIYEIKHSKEAVKEQYKHLVDEDKCAACEYRYGTITGRYVIYRGESKTYDGIEYLNAEEYLKKLSPFHENS
ncbi:MAG: AAA family ATPase [Erysipelotrichaceae bacterium]|nr:AAA family ATPase [Erysipelotrichaceae bacterium]